MARLAAEAGVEHEWTVKPGAPPTRNDPALFDRVVTPLMQRWPRTLDAHAPRGMFAEDFAYYTRSIPSLYFSLGIARDGMGMSGVHSKEFNVHPAALAEGLRLMTSLAVIATTGQMEWR